LRRQNVRYRADRPFVGQPHRELNVGEKVKFAGDRYWWTVKAVTEHFAALTRQAEFHKAGVLHYTVVDWRNGVRGPCNLIGQGWGDRSYTETQCAAMLAEFEVDKLEISQRNWVPVQFADEQAGVTG
jgi:hypothetical protein